MTKKVKGANKTGDVTTVEKIVVLLAITLGTGIVVVTGIKRRKTKND